MAKTSLLTAQTSKTYEFSSVMLVSLSMILYRKVKYSIKGTDQPMHMLCFTRRHSCLDAPHTSDFAKCWVNVFNS